MEGRRQAYWCLLSTDRVSGQAVSDLRDEKLPPARSSAYTSATNGSLLSRKRSEGMGQCFEVLRLAAAFCKGADASFMLCFVSAVGGRLLPWAFCLFHYRAGLGTLSQPRLHLVGKCY